MIIYISGPISGIPDNNREAFYGAEMQLKNWLKGSEYYEIINPQRIAAEVNYEKRFDRFMPRWDDYMRACIRELCRADYIVYLPGTENSTGALLEKQIAEQLGIQELKMNNKKRNGMKRGQ